MTLSLSLRAAAISAAIALPGIAHADVSMTFSGVVSPGSTGTLFVYDSSIVPPATNFDGQPVSISLSIAGSPGSLYVSGFDTSWSDVSQPFPYITNWSGAGFPNDGTHDSDFGFLSTVSLTNTGGSIFLTPTSGFVASTDSDFNLSFNFTFSSPHDPFSSFTDNGLTGGGSFDAFKTFIIDPVIGPYDAFSAGHFTLTSLSQRGVPEPGTWALMLIGFGGLGAAMRSRRALAVG